MDSGEIVVIVVWVLLLVIVWFSIWRLAHSKTPLGGMVRAIWNTMYELASLIPGFGWFFALFVIADSDEELKGKEQLLKDTAERDAAHADTLEQRKQAYEREQEEYWSRLAQDEAARRAKEDELRGAAYRKYGSRDVQLNSDGSRAKMGDGDWVPTSELEKSLRN